MEFFFFQFPEFHRTTFPEYYRSPIGLCFFPSVSKNAMQDAGSNMQDAGSRKNVSPDIEEIALNCKVIAKMMGSCVVLEQEKSTTMSLKTVNANELQKTEASIKFIHESTETIKKQMETFRITLAEYETELKIKEKECERLREEDRTYAFILHEIERKKNRNIRAMAECQKKRETLKNDLQLVIKYQQTIKETEERTLEGSTSEEKLLLASWNRLWSEMNANTESVMGINSASMDTNSTDANSTLMDVGSTEPMEIVPLTSPNLPNHVDLAPMEIPPPSAIPDYSWPPQNHQNRMYDNMFSEQNSQLPTLTNLPDVPIVAPENLQGFNDYTYLKAADPVMTSPFLRYNRFPMPPNLVSFCVMNDGFGTYVNNLISVDQFFLNTHSDPSNPAFNNGCLLNAFFYPANKSCYQQTFNLSLDYDCYVAPIVAYHTPESPTPKEEWKTYVDLHSGYLSVIFPKRSSKLEELCGFLDVGMKRLRICQQPAFKKDDAWANICAKAPLFPISWSESELRKFSPKKTDLDAELGRWMLKVAKVLCGTDPIHINPTQINAPRSIPPFHLLTDENQRLVREQTTQFNMFHVPKDAKTFTADSDRTRCLCCNIVVRFAEVGAQKKGKLSVTNLQKPQLLKLPVFAFCACGPNLWCVKCKLLEWLKDKTRKFQAHSRQTHQQRNNPLVKEYPSEETVCSKCDHTWSLYGLVPVFADHQICN